MRGAVPNDAAGAVVNVLKALDDSGASRSEAAPVPPKGEPGPCF